MCRVDSFAEESFPRKIRQLKSSLEPLEVTDLLAFVDYCPALISHLSKPNVLGLFKDQIGLGDVMPHITEEQFQFVVDSLCWGPAPVRVAERHARNLQLVVKYQSSELLDECLDLDQFCYLLESILRFVEPYERYEFISVLRPILHSLFMVEDFLFGQVVVSSHNSYLQNILWMLEVHEELDCLTTAFKGLGRLTSSEIKDLSQSMLEDEWESRNNRLGLDGDSPSRVPPHILRIDQTPQWYFSR